MIATFWGSSGALLIAGVLSFGALFALFWLAFGTAARMKQDREMSARMQSAAGPGQKVKVPTQQSGGWIPPKMSQFGQRFATAGGFGESLDLRLEAAGVSLRSGEFVVASVVGGLIGAAVGAAVLSNPLMALVVAAVCALLPSLLLRFSLNRRADKLREQLPDVLTIMASSLRAGHSFLQSLDTVSKEITQPAKAEFQRVVAEVRLGRPVEDALEALADRVGSSDFKWAVLAVNIQREVGGNLAEILDNVADTLRERATMRRQVQVLTTEGRLSAWVLTLLPFAIAGYMTLVNPEYIGLLVTNHIGWFMLGGAAGLMTLGILWMRKIVNIDV
jgi:tight adherence protein B